MHNRLRPPEREEGAFDHGPPHRGPRSHRVRLEQPCWRLECVERAETGHRELGAWMGLQRSWGPGA